MADQADTVTVCRHTIVLNQVNGTDYPPIKVHHPDGSFRLVQEWESPGRVRVVHRPDQPHPDGSTVWLVALPP